MTNFYFFLLYALVIKLCSLLKNCAEMCAKQLIGLFAGCSRYCSVSQTRELALIKIIEDDSIMLIVSLF